jgi:hypothetical protein
LAAQSSFANPFQTFEGSYTPSSAPVVTLQNMDYCDWMGFREMTSVALAPNANGDEVFTLNSQIDQTRLTSTWTLNEFRFENAETHSIDLGRISGDAADARYAMSFVDDATTLDFFLNEDDTVKLSINLLISGQYNGPNSCSYSIVLKKLNSSRVEFLTKSRM